MRQKILNCGLKILVVLGAIIAFGQTTSLLEGTSSLLQTFCLLPITLILTYHIAKLQARMERIQRRRAALHLLRSQKGAAESNQIDSVFVA